MDEKLRKTAVGTDITLELDMARDEHGRRLPEHLALALRFYVENNRRDFGSYGEIANVVVAVHKKEPLTIARAVKVMYKDLKGVPDGTEVACALKYALH
jgi:hypothetical protein